MFYDEYKNDPEWIKYRSLFPAIITYDDFTQAMNDGKFHALMGVIWRIDNYGSFSRAWITADYDFKSMTDTKNTHTASCYPPKGAKKGDVLFLIAKLIPGRKSEIDLKWIKYHLIPNQKPSEDGLSDNLFNNY